jgi:uncharacterized protein
MRQSARRISPAGKVFRDPIHGLIRIDRRDEFVLELIDTPEMQRLRRIRQLGVSSLTYHGAEHSRFVHSLGVFNFAQRILDALTRRYRGHAVAEYLELHGKAVKAASLLHDIGHGPFSHVMERAFDQHKAHEQRSVEIIRDGSSHVGAVLRRHGVDAEQVAQLIEHTSPHGLLMDIVSSQLDADRMDYLLRDSYCTGVQYGRYDADWLLNAMCVGRSPARHDASESAPDWRLCLDERRAEDAIEQFIMARAHMNDQVYFHRVTRGYEVLLLNLLRSAVAVSREKGLPAATPPVVARFVQARGALPMVEWLQLDEPAMMTAFQIWSSAGTPAESAMATMSRQFIHRERPYAAVSLGPLLQKRPLTAARLERELTGAGLVEGEHWSIDDAESSVYKGLRYAAGRSRSREEQELESIRLASGDPDEFARPVETSSSLLEHLDREQQRAIRLYFQRDRITELRPIFKGIGLETPMINGDAP